MANYYDPSLHRQYDSSRYAIQPNEFSDIPGVSRGWEGKYYRGGQEVSPYALQQERDRIATEAANQERKQMLSDLMKTADPFASQRQQYQTQLSNLFANPGDFMQSSPVFKSILDAGTEAANRSAAAKGMLGSGNRLLALQEAGQKAASQTFFPMAEMLGKFSGAEQNPASASDVATKLANLTEQQRQFDLTQLPLPGSARGPSVSKTWSLSNFWK